MARHRQAVGVYVDQWPDNEAKNEVWEVVKWLDALDPVRDADAITVLWRNRLKRPGRVVATYPSRGH
jgi:hypothetical protein